MILLAFYVMVSGVALIQEGCDIIGLLCYCVRSGSYAGMLWYYGLFEMVSKGEALMKEDCDIIDLLWYVSGVALMQEVCDIIGHLFYGVWRGSKAGKL